MFFSKARAAACALLITLLYAAPDAGAEQALRIGSDKQLFVDTLLVDRHEGITFTMNSPTRTGRTVLRADAPWELAAEGHIGAYCSILRDQGKTRLWYDIRFGNVGHVAYAESTDGLEFTKPILKLHEVNGSTENNIVMTGKIGGASVWLDPRADADKRYRSQSKGYNPPTAERLYCYYSPDGLDWTLWQTQSIGDCDTQSNAFWDSRLQRYVLYTRTNPNAGTEARSRLVRRLDSDDLQHWEHETVSMRADAVDDATFPVQTPRPPVDYYGAAVFQYPDDHGIYIMLAQPYWHFIALPPQEHRPIDRVKEGKGKRVTPATIDVRLAASRDGATFQRLGNRRPFMSLGPEGSFDSRVVWALPNPIQMGDELWFYYAGGNTDHDGFVDERASQAMSAISVATLRLDGFVSADAAYTGGQLLTQPVIFAGNTLEVNVDAGAGGTLQVELLTENEEPIAGFTRNDANVHLGNSVRMPVTWGTNRDVSPLVGKPIRLRFIMRDCRLYAFQFVDRS